MAAEADKVVVELVANVDKFNADIKSSATGFTASMGQMEKSAGGVETAHKRMSLAANQNRIAMLELQHVVRGSTEQFAAGAPVTQIFAQHVGMVGEAAVLAGGSMGSLGKILSGYWGLAAVAAIGIVTTLIAKHREEGDTVDSLVEKLKKHYETATLQSQADDIWAKSVDGLTESLKKLDDELQKQIGITEKTPSDKLTEAIVKSKDAQDKLNKALERQAELQKQLANLKTSVPVNPPAAGAVGVVVDPAAAARKQQIDATTKALADQRAEVQKAEKAWLLAQQTVRDASVAAAQSVGDATAEASKHIDDLIKKLQLSVAKAGGAGGLPQILAPGDVAAAQTALDDYKKAEQDAAAAGIDFAKVGAEDEVKRLTQSLATGVTPLDTYTKRVEALAKALKDAAEEAKKDPVKQFKQAVIGAEGVGPNKLGSSAAGFGQFMPDTWRHYFDQLFPDKADIDDAAKLAYRNVRSVAEAVIDKATEDYKAVLTKAGQSITAANLYTVHLLGAGDARKLLTAAPATPTSQVLSPAVLAGNPFLKGTVAQAEAAIAKRIGDSSAAVSAGAAALAEGIQKEKEREAQYLTEKDALEGQVVEARKGLAKEAQDVWAFETAAVIAAHKHTEDQIAAQEAAGKYLPEEAKTLRKINDERAKYLQDVVDQRLREKQFAQQTEALQRDRDLQSGSYEAESELLHSTEALARTAEQRRTIEQRLIDLQFAEEKLKNQYVIDWAERVKANKDATEQEKADAQLAENIAKMHQGTLDQRHADATQGNNRANASPLQDFFNQIPQGAQEINAAFEQIAAHGLETFNDALANAIVNFTSLRDVARTVLGAIATDLIKLALQQIELHTIGQLFATTAVAGQAPLAAATAAMWAGPAALVSLATFGANAAAAQFGIASTTAFAALFGSPKAAGGRIYGSGSDTSDNVLTPMSPGEYAIKASSARRLGYDALDYLNQYGEFPPGFANGGMIRPTNGAARSPSGRGGFSQSDMRQLESIVGRAIEAMPSLALYPTLHPADALDAALSSQAGQKRMFGFFKDNSTSIKAHLNRPGS